MSPAVPKLIERQFQKQNTSYFDQFLSKFLCDYRKCYSTQTALILTLEKW